MRSKQRYVLFGEAQQICRILFDFFQNQKTVDLINIFMARLLESNIHLQKLKNDLLSKIGNLKVTDYLSMLLFTR